MVGRGDSNLNERELPERGGGGLVGKLQKTVKSQKDRLSEHSFGTKPGRRCSVKRIKLEAGCDSRKKIHTCSISVKEGHYSVGVIFRRSNMRGGVISWKKNGAGSLGSGGGWPPKGSRDRRGVVPKRGPSIGVS